MSAPQATDLVNGSFPAYPRQALGTDGLPTSEPCPGLTKRELFALKMAQAILTGAVTRGCPSNEWIDQSMAVKCADALLAALEQGK